MKSDSGAMNDAHRGTAYNHVLKYTGLFGGVQGVGVIVSVVRNKVITLLLGAAGLALIDIFNHAMTLFSNLTTFGIPFTAVQRLSELYDGGDTDALRRYVRVVRSWSVLTALLGLVVCLAGATLMSQLSFSNSDYAVRFMLLSPIPAMLAIMGVETAILKACRRLKALAIATLEGAIGSLVLTIPIYLLWGRDGIVAALVLSTLWVTVCNLNASLRVFRWQSAPFSRTVLAEGFDMIRLGLSYLMAGFVAAAAEMGVRAFITNSGSLEDEGFYCSGFMLTVSYARFVFVSMDADYYPRLSAICRDRARMNETINRQIEVLILLIAPFLMAFVLFMPYIIRLLFAESFLQAVPMAVCATFYMFFKALTTPVAYIPLARGDSMTYFVTETIYYIAFVILVVVGYHYYGLVGTGVALSLSNLFDMMLVAGLYSVRYGFRYSRRAVRLGIVQGAMLAATIYAVSECSGWLKYAIALPLLLSILSYNLRLIFRETTFVQSLRRRFSHREEDEDE